MTASEDQMLDLDHYLAKTYCKTASLMANSLRSVAVLSGADQQVSVTHGSEPIPAWGVFAYCEPAGRIL